MCFHGGCTPKLMWWLQGGLIGKEADALLDRVEAAHKEASDAASQLHEARDAAAQAQLQLKVPCVPASQLSAACSPFTCSLRLGGVIAWGETRGQDDFKVNTVSCTTSDTRCVAYLGLFMVRVTAYITLTK